MVARKEGRKRDGMIKGKDQRILFITKRTVSSISCDEHCIAVEGMEKRVQRRKKLWTVKLDTMIIVSHKLKPFQTTRENLILKGIILVSLSLSLVSLLQVSRTNL